MYSERRAHPRFPLILAVQYQGAESVLDYTENLSATGLFICTEREFDVGERVALVISFPLVTMGPGLVNLAIGVLLLTGMLLQPAQANTAIMRTRKRTDSLFIKTLLFLRISQYEPTKNRSLSVPQVHHPPSRESTTRNEQILSKTKLPQSP